MSKHVKYLQTPADRPVDEGQLLQILQLPQQQAGLVPSHPAGEHLPGGNVPVRYWLSVGEQAEGVSTDHP